MVPLVVLPVANHPKQAPPTSRTAEAASAPKTTTMAASTPKAPAASVPKWDWNYRDWTDGMDG
jgi:hypothetical protein